MAFVRAVGRTSMKETKVRLVIETKSGFRFGYERITREDKPEPKPLTYNPLQLKGREVDYYA